MSLNRKYQVNLDAMIVIALLFVIALTMNVVLYLLYSDLVDENFALQKTNLTHELNLGSMEAYVNKLEGQLREVSAAGPSSQK